MSAKRQAGSRAELLLDVDGRTESSFCVALHTISPITPYSRLRCGCGGQRSRCSALSLLHRPLHLLLRRRGSRRCGSASTSAAARPPTCCPSSRVSAAAGCALRCCSLSQLSRVAAAFSAARRSPPTHCLRQSNEQGSRELGFELGDSETGIAESNSGIGSRSMGDDKKWRTTTIGPC